VVFADLLREQESCTFHVDVGMKCADNLNTTQTPEYTKDKYNTKIIK
jgi:hypothetical protein